MPTSLRWKPLQVKAQRLSQRVPENVAKQFNRPVGPHCPQALECQTRAGGGGAVALWPAAQGYPVARLLTVLAAGE